MSKLSIVVSYKDACILKHALRDKVKEKESWIQANSDGVYNTCDDEKKELEEEKRALGKFTDEIDRNMKKHNKLVRDVKWIK